MLYVNYGGPIDNHQFVNNEYGIRPVVCLSSSISATESNNLWTLTGIGGGGATPAISLASQIQGHEKEIYGYGSKINYPFDIDDLDGDGDGDNPSDTDWLVFYQEGSYVYIVPDDYVPTSLISDDAVDKNTSGNYVTYGAKLKTTENSVATTVRDLFLINEFPTTSTGYENYQASATLLKSDNWSNFAISGYAEAAVGAPTVEMWMESWNKKYEGNASYEQNLDYVWSSGKNGYLVYPSEKAQDMFGGAYFTDTLTGYASAPMYFPHTTSSNINNTGSKCNGYWLASPSAFGTSHVVIVSYNGNVYSNDYSNNSLAAWPVVCLESDIPAVWEDGMWKLRKLEWE